MTRLDPAVDDLIKRGAFVSRTRVRTPGVMAGGITAWHVRQFTKALDAASILDTAQIDMRRAADTMHLIELSTYQDETQ